MRVLLTNGDFLVQPKAGAQQVNTAANNTCAQCTDNWPKYIDTHTHTGRQTAHTHTHIQSCSRTHLFACTRAGQTLRCLLAFGTGAQHYRQRHTCSCCWRKLCKLFLLLMCLCVIRVCVCLWIGNANVSCEWQCQCKSARTQREWRNQRIKSRNFNYK